MQLYAIYQDTSTSSLFLYIYIYVYIFTYIYIKLNTLPQSIHLELNSKILNMADHKRVRKDDNDVDTASSGAISTDESKSVNAGNCLSAEAEVSPVPPTFDALKKKWDGFSKLYAEEYQDWALPGLQQLVSNLALRENGGDLDILEIGCGPGAATARILPQIPPVARYIACDFSSQMVQRARETLKSGCIKEIFQCPASKIPVPSSSFDRVISNLVFMLVPDADAALREAARVLRPGGILGLVIWGRRERSPFFTIESKVLNDLKINTGSSVDGYTVPTRSNFHLIDECSDKVALPELRTRVQAAGFENVLTSYMTLSRGCVSSQVSRQNIPIIAI